MNSIFTESNNSPFAYVEVETLSTGKNIRNCTIKIQYPSIKPKLTSPVEDRVTKKVNKYLKKNFQNIKRYDNDFECNRNAQKSDPAFYLEIKYEVKYNEKNFLSIYYYAVGYSSGAPHPNHVNKAFTFNLKDGEVIEFEQVFIPETNYLSVLNSKILEDLLKLGVISSEAEFAELKKNKYDFYLSKDSITIFNIYDIHAMQSLEVKIPFKKIIKVINREKIPM